MNEEFPLSGFGESISALGETLLTLSAVTDYLAKRAALSSARSNTSLYNSSAIAIPCSGLTARETRRRSYTSGASRLERYEHCTWSRATFAQRYSDTTNGKESS